MPILSNIRIWGRHFALETKLSYSDASGYTHAESFRYRLSPYSEHSKLLTDSSKNIADFSVFLSSDTQESLFNNRSQDIPHDEDINNPIELISKEIGKTIKVWELNFDIVKKYDSNHVLSKHLDYESMLKDRQYKSIFKDIDTIKEQLYNAFKVNPIISHTYEDQIINAKILDYILSDFYNNESKDTELLIVTGEMLWSGWLNMFLITQLLHNGISSNIEVIFDCYGVWQALIRSNSQTTELYKIGKEFFKPDLSFFVDLPLISKSRSHIELELKKESTRKLILGKDRVGLFDLGEGGYKLQNKNYIPQLLYLKFFNRPKFNSKVDEKKYDKWWKGTDYLLQKNINSVVSYYPRTLNYIDCARLSLPDRFSKKVGDILEEGEVTGQFNIIHRKFMDMNGVDSYEERLSIVNGQLINKGDSLFDKKLFGVNLNARSSGKVDFSLLDQGIIQILKARFEVDHAPINGTVEGIKMNKYYNISSYFIHFYVSKYIGNSDVSGYLVNKQMLEGDFEKALYLESLDKYDFNIDSVQEYRVRVIIIPSAGYDEIVEFIKKEEIRMGVVNVIILNRLGDKDKYLGEMLMKYMGKYICINNKGTVMVPYNSKQFTFSMPLKEDAIQNKINYSLGVGKEIQIINYRAIPSYVRIESVSGSNILVNTGKELLYVSLDNIIEYIHGYN